jgi:hypothetical protein
MQFRSWFGRIFGYQDAATNGQKLCARRKGYGEHREHEQEEKSEGLQRVSDVRVTFGNNHFRLLARFGSFNA